MLFNFVLKHFFLSALANNSFKKYSSSSSIPPSRNRPPNGCLYPQKLLSNQGYLPQGLSLNL